MDKEDKVFYGACIGILTLCTVSVVLLVLSCDTDECKKSAATSFAIGVVVGSTINKK